MIGYSYVNGKKLKNGYTTGSCATAAAKSAALMLKTGELIEWVEIITPSNIKLRLQVENIKLGKNYVICSIKKDSGDDPDITNKIDIFAKVSYRDDKKINIFGGIGIGKITKNGLKIPVGQSAINPTPLKMIKEALLDVDNKGFDVEIFAPEGEYLAKKTFNPKLGIIGGISILGSTGIVKPMSEEAFKESLAIEMEILAKNKKSLFMTPGNFGKKYLMENGVKDSDIFVCSNFIGFMIDYAHKLGIKNIIFAGHIGKLVKVSSGIFHTHSKIADGRFEALASAALLAGENSEDILKILSSNTTDEALQYLKLDKSLEVLIKRIKNRCEERAYNEINFEISIFDFTKGELIKTKGFTKGIEEYYG